MKIQETGVDIKKSDFLKLFDSTKDVFSLDSAGMGNGKIEIPTKAGNVQFLFVKDETTGATCCYYKSPRYNADAHFVADVKASKDSLTLYRTQSKAKTKAFVIDTSKGFPSEVMTALARMIEPSENPNFQPLYDSIKSKIFLVSKDDENVYAIEVPNAKNKKSTDTAYLVVGAHPKKAGKHALYYLTELPKNLDLNDSANILTLGGKVVHRVETDKNGELAIAYYKDENTIERKKLQAYDTAKGLKAWAESRDKNFDHTKVLYKEKTLKSSRICKKVLVGVAVAVIGLSALAVPGTALIGPDETQQAKTHGTTQVTEFVREIESGKMLRYENGKVVGIGEVQNLLNDFTVYKQSSIFGWAKKYPTQTVEGFAFSLGQKLVEEARDNGVATISVDDKGNKVSNYIYVVSPTDPIKAISSPELMETNLGLCGFSDEEVETFMKSFEAGQDKANEGLLIKGDQIVGSDVVGEPTVEINYEDESVKAAIETVIAKYTKNGGKYSAEDLSVIYVSADEGVMFVSAGEDAERLYKISFAGAPSTSEEYADAISKSTNVEESARLDILTARLNVEKYVDSYQESYKNATDEVSNVNAIYVGNCSSVKDFDNGMYGIQPKLTIVSNDGKVIEERESDKVLVKQGSDVGLTEMIAISVLNSQGLFIKGVSVENVSANEVIHNSNDMDIEGVAAILKNSTENGKVL